MKKAVFLVFLLLLASCASRQEAVKTRPAPEAPKVTAAVRPPEPVAPPRTYRSYLKCDEKTDEVYNRSGIEVMPFIRLAFYDLDSDGSQEIIAGAKDGSLRMYKRSGSKQQKWTLDQSYFDGVKVGAFASPTAGDIDNDGKPEIAVGTGGFSSESGRVIFYRNTGSRSTPRWQKMNLPEISVGNDATPVLADVDKDGRQDLVIGNSTGNLVLYRNRAGSGKTAFTKDAAYFKGVDLGMYATPAVAVQGGKVVVIAGNNMGKLSLLERPISGNASWQRVPVHVTMSHFAAPAFLASGDQGVYDLVISDGNGQIFHYKNRQMNYRQWDESRELFSGRVLPGPVCTPVVTELGKRSCLVTGNLNGEVRLFEHDPLSIDVPWREKQHYFKGVKLSGFSRGVLVPWQGKYLLITGQQDGIVKAFLNAGTTDAPSWIEQKMFFHGVPKIMHASPTVFDIDQDGRWELIVGDVEGRVRAFRYDLEKDGRPVWQSLDSIFGHVKVDRYASPTLLDQNGKMYLFVGQQDGRIQVFHAERKESRYPVFAKDETLQGIRVNNHSSPSAYLRGGSIELSVGDYDGNLKHFACREDKMEIR
jgi:hypothetical protein